MMTKEELDELIDEKFVREMHAMMMEWALEDAREVAETGTLRLEPGDKVVRFN